MNIIQKRKSSDLCLLCQKRPATEKRSHIIPKFMMATMFSGNQVSVASKAINKSSSPRAVEAFLLCPLCEDRFSFLETYVSKVFFHPYRQDISQFPLIPAGFPNPLTEQYTHYLVYLNEQLNKVSPTLFKLFVYSILWRAAISRLPVFDAIKLEASLLENLRQELDVHIAYTSDDLLNYEPAYEVQRCLIPFGILIAPKGVNLIGTRGSSSQGILYIIAHEAVFQFWIRGFSADIAPGLNLSAKLTEITLLSPAEAAEFGTPMNI